MKDIANVDTGTKITRSTSYHEEFSPNNILDSSTSKPWMTTGMFPQEIIVTFPTVMHIQSIDIKCNKIKEILVESSSSDKLENFREISEKIIGYSMGSVQTENITNEELKARHVRIRIFSAYDIFCAIYKLVIMGTEASDPSNIEDKALSGSQSGFTRSFSRGLEEKPKSQFSFGHQNQSVPASDSFKFGDAFHSAGASKQPPTRGLGESDSDSEALSRVQTSKKVRLDGNSENQEDNDEDEDEIGQTMASLVDRDEEDNASRSFGMNFENNNESNVQEFKADETDDDEDESLNFGGRFGMK